tara:strand:+ start:1413 stop:2432 length:1020 start_codon:yes stop_codon:yes gene_type:complete
MKESTKQLLVVEDLHVEFTTFGGTVNAVRGVSFSIEAGETLAIVGESGCGKSVTVQSLLGLIPMPPGKITRGNARIGNTILIKNGRIGADLVRGSEIGMIFQDPMTSLNPTMTIGHQISEPLEIHKGLTRTQAMKQAIDLLHLVQIPNPAMRAKQYPHEFSGGMLQRAMIAMAIGCEPSVLIADEPTTALDVTIQAQILGLMKTIQKKTGMGLILITHDLGVVSQMSNKVAIMYGGRIMEEANTNDIFTRPAHPYNLGLQAAMPDNESTTQTALLSIEGTPPDLFKPPKGCAYAERCPNAMKICYREEPKFFEIEGSQQSRCWLHHEDSPKNVTKLFFG